MGLKIIITGSTGMVGKGLLLECLDSNSVQSVLVINRKPVGIKHAKLKEIIHGDLADLTLIKEQLKGYNVFYACMGVTVAGLSEQEYTHLTYTITNHCAKVMLEQNPNSYFCYVSGTATDSSEQGRVMWARVKGKTENSILKMDFKKAWMFRPGYIQPMAGIRSKTALYNTLYVIFKPFYFILKHFPKYVTSSETLAKAMISVVLNDHPQPILESVDINKIVENKPK